MQKDDKFSVDLNYFASVKKSFIEVSLSFKQKIDDNAK